MRLNDLNLLDDRLHDLVNVILEDCNKLNLPFVVFETGRSLERQEKLVKNKVSKTLKSKHLIKYVDNKLVKKSLAVDLVLKYTYNNKVVYSWANVGDQKQRDRDLAYYKMLSEMVTTRYQELSKDLGIKKIVSGGKWKKFHDWPHYEVS